MRDRNLSKTIQILAFGTRPFSRSLETKMASPSFECEVIGNSVEADFSFASFRCENVKIKPNLMCADCGG